MITTKEMRDLEDNCGIPKITLMENAGKGIFQVMKKRFPDLKTKKILVIANHGNNGGDGFVAARYLETQTDILFIGDEGKFKQEGESNYKRVRDDKKIHLYTRPDRIDFNDYDIIIDAILGTGTKGPLREPISSIIDLINGSKAYKIAVDIPTGMNPDTGDITDKVVEADLIITFHDIKKGLYSLKEKTVIIDVGIRGEKHG